MGPEIQEMSLDRKNEIDEVANSRLKRNSYTSGWVCTGAVKEGNASHPSPIGSFNPDIPW
jgi:hypothetical protein